MKIKREMQEWITITCPQAEAHDAIEVIRRGAYSTTYAGPGKPGQYRICGYREAPKIKRSRKAKAAA